MSGKMKIWLLVAASLVVAGGLIFGGAMTMLKWDFSRLSTSKHETNTYAIGEAFQDISIVTDTADVVFEPSEDDGITVVCKEREKLKHTVCVENGTLEIKLSDTRKWYDHVGIHFGAPKITVSIPAGAYGALSVQVSTGAVSVPEEFQFESIEAVGSTGNISICADASDSVRAVTTTGNIRMEKVSAGEMVLAAATGSVTVADVTCEGDVKVNVSTEKTSLKDVVCANVVSNGSTGELKMENVIAGEKIYVERSTGDVRFRFCDAAEIFIKTGTGDVTGSLLTEKIFLTQTHTGSVDVPKTTTGGKCEVETSTGDIKLEILQKA